jgi:hypothetical protein
MNDSVNRQFSRRLFLGSGTAATAAFAVALPETVPCWRPLPLHIQRL